ncbi:hypothetical protein QBC35DRAFT_536451 [Podospora australis]|uniref:Uncharacterized protein n=1 Tax=Podospora australis TaxID=1536484 RepID=A0AAN6WI12_9PEZI|nr:hypothetical protein QBC35DRAFT_536451 [Podospora australis]
MARRFHDGNTRLRCADEFHDEALKGCAEDDTLRGVSKIILDKMLHPRESRAQDVLALRSVWMEIYNNRRDRPTSHGASVPPSGPDRIPNSNALSPLATPITEVRSFNSGGRPFDAPGLVMTPPTSSHPPWTSSHPPPPSQVHGASTQTPPPIVYHRPATTDSATSTETLQNYPTIAEVAQYLQSRKWQLQRVRKQDFPMIRRMLDNLGHRHHVSLLVLQMNSITMQPFQENVSTTVRVLTKLLKHYVTSKDHVKLFLASKSKRPHSLRKSSALEGLVRRDKFEAFEEDFYLLAKNSWLRDRADEVLTLQQPVSLYFLTDGVVDQPGFVAAITTILESVKVLPMLGSMTLYPRKFTFTVIKFGSDPLGAEILSSIHSSLHERYGSSTYTPVFICDYNPSLSIRTVLAEQIINSHRASTTQSTAALVSPIADANLSFPRG